MVRARVDVAPASPSVTSLTARVALGRGRDARSFSDAGTVVLAASAAAGAWLAHPLPLAVGLVGGLVAWRRRWRLVFVLAVAALASSLSARSQAGLKPVRVGPFRGVVTLVSDPRAAPGGVEAVVRDGRRRLNLVARGAAGDGLMNRLAGQRVRARGELGPLSPGMEWLRWSHVVGQVEASAVEPDADGAWPWRLANGVHRLVSDGSKSLPEDLRPLYTGFLLGDVSGQTAEMASDMRASGLGHLLVVSGENVAFLLVLAGPLLRRIPLRGRWAAVGVLLAFFALLTRFEPSVLRAVVMAGLGAAAASLGRELSGVRALALAVTALVLVDPLLVHQVGFGLSVGATAGIVLVASKLAQVVPGPRAPARAMATTMAAQIGVGPVAVAVFGGLPVAAVPANVLAAPAAAFVLVWGLPAGVIAACAPAPIGGLVQAPTRWLLSWVAGVARWCGGLPLGQLRGGELAALGGAVLALALSVTLAQRSRSMLLGGAAVAAIVALALPGLTLRDPPHREPIAGAVVWRTAGATVVVLDPLGREQTVLDGLHRAGVRRVDLLVAGGGGPMAAGVVLAIRHRWSVAAVLGPDGNQIRGARTPQMGEQVRVGGLVVAVRAVTPHLEVSVRPIGPVKPAAAERRSSPRTAPVASARGARARGPPVQARPASPGGDAGAGGRRDTAAGEGRPRGGCGRHRAPPGRGWRRFRIRVGARPLARRVERRRWAASRGLPGHRG